MKYKVILRESYKEFEFNFSDSHMAVMFMEQAVKTFDGGENNYELEARMVIVKVENEEVEEDW